MNRRQSLLGFMVLFVLIGLLVGGMTEAQESGEQTQTDRQFKAGELLVRLKADIVPSAVEHALDRYDAAYLRNLYNSELQLWRVPEGRELALVEQLAANSIVEHVQPNYAYHALVEPNDPNYDDQWAHTKINSAAAWDIITGSQDIVIAIIDTGIDETHPDLADKIVPGYDFADYPPDSDPHDLNGHGTHCAGIAAAATNNGIGIAGLDWNAHIMPLRVLDEQGNGYTSDIINGITWAYQHGAKVLSLSLGGDRYDLELQNAVNAAHSAGSLVVAAMGNYRQEGNPTNYPAAYDNVMAVAATGPNDVYAPYSQYGDHCAIAAPGGAMSYLHDPDGIYSTMPTYPVYMTSQYGYNTNYDYVNGTSQATPYVAGLAALVWAVDPLLSPAGVQQIIQNTAIDLGSQGWDQDYGWGRIDAYAALQAAAPPPPQAPDLLYIHNADGDGDYMLRWDPVLNATSYTLQEDDNPDFSSPELRYGGSNTQFAISDQAAGAWYYRVLASNDYGDSPWSNTQWVEVLLALRVTPCSLTFLIEAGNTAAMPQTLQVESTGRPLAWTLTISDSIGWLEAAPLSGTTPGVVTVAVDISGFSSLLFEAFLVIETEPGVPGGQVIPVSLVVIDNVHYIFLPIVRKQSS